MTWRAPALTACRLSACALVLMLAACAFERPISHVPTSFDLGPPPAYARANPAIPGIVLVAPVTAAAPLDDSGIVYRLLYQDAAKPQVYAESRWTDEPARLVTERIRARLGAMAKGVVAPNFGVRSDYAVRVDLLDFSQYFDAPGQSRAALRARATLVESDSRRVLAQRNFELERPAGGDAAGAVKALTEAVDVFIEELARWTVENAKAMEEVTKRSDGKK